MGPMMAASMGLQGIGALVSAGGTMAAGNYAKASGEYTAEQLEQNASGEIAAGQRQALDTKQRATLAGSSLTAKAAAAGVNVGVGSPVSDAGDVAQRGEYQSLMEMWQGQNRATGLINQAQAARYGGQAQQDASQYAAYGTLASGAGSMFSTYGRYQYPQVRSGYG